ncbi:MAG TPA: peptidylprolyl isomerase [Terriglobales bacterium]|nr:peptidylprolyl isomerase [Terriglobales bacterium]
MKRLFLVPGMLLVAAVCLSADTVVEEIVARVNSDIITRSELQRSRQQLLQELRQGGPQEEAKQPERERDLLRDLIDRQLLLQKGKDLGITGDTEVVKRLDQMRKQMNLDSMEDLEKAAQQQGVSFEDYKQNLRDSIITQAVISREVGSHIQMTAEETKAFYDQHQKELERPEEVRLSEILVSTAPKPPANASGDANAQQPAPAGDDPQAIATAETKARALLDSIRKGAAFDDVARKNSDGPTAAQGGDIGYFKRGTLAKSLEDVTFGLKAGEVSDVIRTKQGFVVLKVTEHIMPGVPPMKDVEQNIQEAIYYQKLQPALRSYLTKLREEAYIDIKPGFVDSGASPNQTKPVMTAASAEQDKDKGKLKKKKHFIFF